MVCRKALIAPTCCACPICVRHTCVDNDGRALQLLSKRCPDEAKEELEAREVDSHHRVVCRKALIVLTHAPLTFGAHMEAMIDVLCSNGSSLHWRRDGEERGSLVETNT